MSTPISTYKTSKYHGNRTKKCEQCDSEFPVENWYQENVKQFCSSKCKAASGVMKGVSGRPRTFEPCDKTCGWCEKTFHADTRYKVRFQKYCSQKCKGEANGNGRRVKKVKRKCATCGKKVFRLPCFSEGRKNVFCSMKCRNVGISKRVTGKGNPAFVGSATYWKRQARERDNFTCQFVECGIRDEGKGTHAHHKIPRSVGGEDALENLITLCAGHHHEIEGLLLKELVERYPNATKIILRRLYNEMLN